MSDKFTEFKSQKASSAGYKQLAIRLDDHTLEEIDKRRIEESKKTGSIPSRSEIVRMALDQFLYKK
jgi:metal-responsive CopG/Arc/MetJ family transcriptional regulator